MNQTESHNGLMKKIYVSCFAMTEIGLYLDTHPYNAEALSAFNECARQYSMLLKEHAKYYGPLTLDTANVSCSDYFNWVNEPWPWQEGGC